MTQIHVDLIQNAVNAVKSMKVKNFYFVACGGSMASLSLGDYYIDKEVDVPTRVYTSNEFIHRAPKALNENSVVILKSHSGNTPETVRAAEIAKEKGAITIAMTMLDDSPLWSAVDYPVHYNYGPGVDAYENDNGIFNRLLFGILNAVDPNEKYERVLENLKNLQSLFDLNKKNTLEDAKAFGRNYKREELIYTMASGAYYPIAYSFTSCLLMEMLWINSNAIHSGEYFHGPFEVTDYDVPFLIIKGNGASRPLDERAIAFAEKYSKRLVIVDVEKLDYPGVDADIVEYFGPIVTNAVLRQYAQELSDNTGHPLSVRRYMWKMEY